MKAPAPNAALLRRAAQAHADARADEAEALYRRALALAPGWLAALRGLGLLLAQTGRAAEAAKLLQAVARARPADAEANGHLGLARLALGEAGPALHAFELALLAQPRAPALWLHRARALAALKREEEAEASLDNALRLSPDFAEAWLNKGNLILARGDLVAAIAAYDRAGACNPKLAAPRFNRANALRDLGRAEEALAAYEAALARDPRFYAAAVNRANLIAALGRLEEADAAYAKAIEIDPREPEAWSNRGAILTRAGRAGEAVACLARALLLRPDHVDAAFNLGLAQRERRQPQAALEAFDRALALAPRFAKAMSGRGLALRDLGRPEEALAAYDEALRLDPDYVDAAINRASLLNAHGQSALALAGIDRALSRAPGSAAAWSARAHALFEMNDTDGALWSHREALRIGPDLPAARFGEAMANLRILYRDEADIARRRADYAAALERLAEWAARVEPTDEILRAAGRAQPFFLAYQNENDRDLQARYGAMLRGLVARRYPDAAPTRLVEGEKLRVGIVSAFFRNHSNWKIPIRGWLEGLDRERFAVFGYHLGAERDEATQAAAKLCDRFVAGPLPDAEWRREILADRPHALIYPGLMMDETSLILAAQRLAPVQCNSWGHPDTSGLPTLDYFLGSEAMDGPQGEGQYSEKLVRLPGLSIVYRRPEVEAAPLRRANLGLEDDAFVFWSGQTLMKYLPQFDDVFARIAERIPQARLLFLNFPRAPEITAAFRRRLARAFARRGLDAERHCRFVGPFSQAEYLGAMKLCDALLDSIGWSGCNSLLESLEAELPAVTWPGDTLRSRHGAAILAALGDEVGVVASLDAYVEEAAQLAGDGEHLRRRKLTIKQGRARLEEGREVVRGLENFLEVALRAA